MAASLPAHSLSSKKPLIEASSNCRQYVAILTPLTVKPFGSARANLARRSGFADFVHNMGVKTDSAGVIASVAKWFVRLIVMVVAFDMHGHRESRAGQGRYHVRMIRLRSTSGRQR